MKRDCHIIPVAYISAWATIETCDYTREKRKCYIVQKNTEEQVILKKIVKIKGDTIRQDYLYINEGDEFIENEMDRIYEKKWKDYVKKKEIEALKNIDNEIDIEDYLLRFFTLQIYRTKEYMDPALKITIEIIKNCLPQIPTQYIQKENTQFLRVLETFLKGNDGAMMTSFLNFKENYSKIILISDGSSEFISCDLPAYSIINDELFKGMYFPISPKLCMYIYKGKRITKSKARIKIIGENTIKFINNFTYDRAKNIVFSSTNKIKENKSNLYEKIDFEKIFI